MIEAPSLRPLAELTVKLGPPMALGDSPRGTRRIIPIVGGTVSGRIRGEILNLGADWQTILADGTAELDTRYAIRTHDGALIDIRNYGLRHGPPEAIAALARGETVDPGTYYMRSWPRFETGDARYAWLNRLLALGSGARDADQVRLAIFEIA
ncbi:MAG: DUF3237 domain-containing protein [Pseudomonadota bacterium]